MKNRHFREPVKVRKPAWDYLLKSLSVAVSTRSLRSLKTLAIRKELLGNLKKRPDRRPLISLPGVPE